MNPKLYNFKFTLASHNTDYEPRIRDNIIEYLIEKYGRDNTSNVGTYGVLKTKSAIQDVCRVFSIPASDVIAVTTKLSIDLEDEALPLDAIEKNNPALAAFLDSWTDRLGKDLRFFINGVRGSIRQPGVHASGFLVSSVKLSENIAMMKSKTDIISAWQEGNMGRELSYLNYAKIDILGLQNLQVMNDAAKLVKDRRGKEIVWTDVDIDEQVIYDKIILVGDLAGVFQFEKKFVINMVRDIAPKNFEQFAAISAILRPGPLQMGMDKEFARRNRGITWDDPKDSTTERPWSELDIPEVIRDIMAPTLGVLTYQEQCMLISTRIGGFTDKDSNKLRKDLTKGGKQYHTNPDVRKSIDKHKDKFISNASKPENLGNLAEAQKLWDLMFSFAAYGFNKSHSICYTYISFYECYLKYYYGPEFYTALLNNTPPKKKKDDYSMMEIYLSEMMRHGFNINKPNVNFSDEIFTIEGEPGTAGEMEIYFGLAWIKNLTKESISKLVNERKEKGKYSSIDDMVERLTKKFLNKKIWEALIWSGALDDFLTPEMDNRSKLYNHIFTTYRKTKFETPSDSTLYLMNKEIDYCNISLSEIIEVGAARQQYLANNPSKVVHTTADLSAKGSWNIVGKVSQLANKLTKTGKKYISVKLKDGSGESNFISVWSWECQGMDDLRVTQIIAANVVRNEQGFLNLVSYSEIAGQHEDLKKAEREVRELARQNAREQKDREEKEATLARAAFLGIGNKLNNEFENVVSGRDRDFEFKNLFFNINGKRILVIHHDSQKHIGSMLYVRFARFDYVVVVTPKSEDNYFIFEGKPLVEKYLRKWSQHEGKKVDGKIVIVPRYEEVEEKMTFEEMVEKIKNAHL
jgi:DNA polymerase III subunit alpha